MAAVERIDREVFAWERRRPKLVETIDRHQSRDTVKRLPSQCLRKQAAQRQEIGPKLHPGQTR
eukprot:5317988-Amphidinium_carterae.1